jgi:pimeloyl-ACP methyl ester carboxylesterase
VTPGQSAGDGKLVERQHHYAFLHGGIQGSWVWEATLAALCRQTEGKFGRALALDVPGCGTKRKRATGELTLDDVAAELVDEIERASLREVVLVGHSQGGTLLPRLLGLRPELFRRAIYVSCIAPPAGQTVLEFSQSTLVPARAEEPSPAEEGASYSTERLGRMFCNDMGPEQAAAFLGRLGQDAWPPHSYTARDWGYDHIGKTPSTYLICLRDQTVPPPVQETCASRLGVSRRVYLDAGHQVMVTRPHALAEALLHEASAD